MLSKENAGECWNEERLKEWDMKVNREKERCSGSYCQAVAFLVMKDDSFSLRPG